MLQRGVDQTFILQLKANEPESSFMSNSASKSSIGNISLQLQPLSRKASKLPLHYMIDWPLPQLRRQFRNADWNFIIHHVGDHYHTNSQHPKSRRKISLGYFREDLELCMHVDQRGEKTGLKPSFDTTHIISTYPPPLPPLPHLAHHDLLPTQRHPLTLRPPLQLHCPTRRPTHLLLRPGRPLSQQRPLPQFASQRPHQLRVGVGLYRSHILRPHMRKLLR